jgi:hypothetical protein
LYTKDTDAVIYVIDSLDRDRIDLARTEMIGILGEEALQNVPGQDFVFDPRPTLTWTNSVLVLSNKQDLPGTMSVAEVSERLGLTLLRKNPWHIGACSATSGEGVVPAFDWLINEITKKWIQRVLLVASEFVMGGAIVNTSRIVFAREVDLPRPLSGSLIVGWGAAGRHLRAHLCLFRRTRSPSVLTVNWSAPFTAYRSTPSTAPCSMFLPPSEADV